jgi:hypothetical protein
MCEISIESEINKNIENSMSDSLVSIEINDIFDELNEENYRLRKQLFLSNKYNTILEKFKQYLDLNSNKCQCFESNRNQLNLIYDEFNEFSINELNINKTNNNFDLIDVNERENYNKYGNYSMSKPVVNKAKKSFNSGLSIAKKSLKCGTNVKKRVELRKYKCVWNGCDFKTHRNKLLSDHMNIHYEIRPYLCNDSKCGKTFFSQKCLKEHQKRHISGKGYKMSTASEELVVFKSCYQKRKVESQKLVQKKVKRIRNENNLKVVVKKEKDLDLNESHISYNNNKMIDNNNNDNNNNSNNDNNNCDNQKSSVYTLKKYRYMCSWVGCDFRTQKNIVFRDHMNIHKDIRPYVCAEPNCRKQFFSAKSLGAHRKRHLSSGDYKCSYPDCSFSGRTLDIVMAHIKLNHSNHKPFFCSNCDLCLETEFAFRRHLASHLDLNYKCDFENCEFKCNQLSKYKIHIRKHTGEKPFKCDFPNCGKVFSGLGGLKDHQIRHSDLRPYPCSWPGCESKFKRANDLKMHCMSSFD